MADSIGVGKISRVELRAVPDSLGETATTEPEVDQMQVLQDLIANGDGEIDLLEPSTSNSKSPSVSSSETGGDDEDIVSTLRSALHVFDSDKDGRISTEELRRVLSDVDEYRTAAWGTMIMRAKGPAFSLSDLITINMILAAGLPCARASSPSAPGSSEDHSALYYLGIGATIVSPVIALISLGATIYIRKRRKGETTVNPEPEP